MSIKNEQLVCDPQKGDCFRACVTSILGIPNSPDLPGVDSKDWFIQWYRFLEKYGVSLHYEEKAIWKDGYWIASVKSKNFPNVTHSIVMKDQEVWFDPSPKEKYQEGENLLGKDVVFGGWHFEVTDFSKLPNLFPRHPGVEEVFKIIEKYIPCAIGGKSDFRMDMAKEIVEGRA